MSVSRTASPNVASTQSTPAAVSGMSIGGYLIERLQDHGVRDIFGIPGDYVLAFYAQLEKSPLRTIGCTREDCAGFAADAFQMTGMELSTIVRHAYHPIVIVLDNEGYGTERLLHQGDYEFNEIHAWNYSKLPAVLGHGIGYEVGTEGQFDDALRAAWEDRETMSIIHVHLGRNDSSKPLARLAERLCKKI